MASYHSHTLEKLNNSEFTWGYYLVLFLAAFMPFEDFILKFIPGPTAIFFASRFISEILIYAAFSLITFKKIFHRIPWKRTPLDLPLYIFILAFLVSTFASSSDLLGAIISLRPIIRYYFLSCLIINISLKEEQVNNIIDTVITAGAIQVGFGFFQATGLEIANRLLMPREADVQVGDVVRQSGILAGKREAGSIYGATSDTIYYSLFLLVVFIIVINRLSADSSRKPDLSVDITSYQPKVFLRRPQVLSILLILLLIASGLAYVRVVLLINIGILFVYFYRRINKKIFIVIFLELFILLGLSFYFFPPKVQFDNSKEQNPIENLTSAFTVEYIENNIKNQRLNQVFGITPTVIFNRPIFGYGPVANSVIEKINDSKPRFIHKDIILSEYGDVYWVAILANYGLCGFIAFIWVFFRLFYCMRMVYRLTSSPRIKEISLITRDLLIVTCILMFMNRCFELRIYSFYFWLLPALTLSLFSESCRRESQQI